MKLNGDILGDLQRSVQKDRNLLLEELIQDPSGTVWCRKHTNLADQVWRLLLREMHRLYPDCPPVSVAATGGYGRQELSPHSDIDITLVPAAEDGNLDQAIKWLFKAADQVIRNALGLRLAYVYRTASEIPGLDPVSLSNLLDLRLVAGSPEPTRKLEETLWHEFPSGPFILAKLEERQRDFESTHTSPMVVEPNIKSGAGGLRCFHTANWIGQAFGERPIPPDHNVEHILLVRNLLHFVAERQQDHLNRNRREQVADLLGQDPYDFGASLSVSLHANHEHYLESIQRIHEARFSITQGAKAVRGELRLEAGCTTTDAAIAVDTATRLNLIIPNETPAVTHENDPTVLSAFHGGEESIRNLSRSGVLAALLPEFEACKTLMPRDASHRFTVYEHTLVALRNYESIEPNSPIGEISSRIKDVELLVLAILLHDAGKNIPDRDHSESGAEIAKNVCQRWGLDKKRSRMVVWLIKEHLTMSKFMRMRDVMHPDTAQEFAAEIKDDQLLHMLTILTYVDVKAVNYEIWTPVQEQLLIELHARTWAILRSKDPTTPHEDVVRKQLVRRQHHSEVSDEDFAEFLDSLPAHYVLSTDSKTALDHYILAQHAKEGDVEITFKDDNRLGVSELTIAAPDTPGSLTKILGVLYSFEVKILGLRVSSTSGDNPILLDTFTVTTANHPVNKRQQSLIEKALVSVLEGADLDELMASHGKEPDRRQDFLQVNVVPHDPAIIEIRAPRGRGLAYRLARVIAEIDLNVVAARLGQWAGSASAAFYVTSRSGKPIDPNKVKRAFLKQSPPPLEPESAQVSSDERPLS